MPFDAVTEATKIENMAKDRIDSKGESTVAASKALTSEWASLSKAERDQVAQAMEGKYSNHAWNDMPVPAPVTDGNGHCVAIIFTASALDGKSNAAAIDLWTNSSAGKERAEISVRQSSQSQVFVPETKLATP